MKRRALTAAAAVSLCRWQFVLPQVVLSTARRRACASWLHAQDAIVREQPWSQHCIGRGSSCARHVNTEVAIEGCEGRLAKLRARHRWNVEELLDACRNNTGTQTCVLIDRPIHPSNVGSVLRQATVLQSPGNYDSVSAVILSCSIAAQQASAFPSEKFMKSALRISLAARHSLQGPCTRLVALQGHPKSALQALRQEGYTICALENREVCIDGARAPPSMAIWDAPLAESERLLFLAGSEDCGLSDELLQFCDMQAYIPGAACDLAPGKSERQKLGQQGQNPSLNLAHAVVIALYERRWQVICKGGIANT
eukprot:TRINITY_DN9128_c0_g1_i1.p1 TRINITY_DN9128_c0_g1~~TRINITY_DN9128_c0_g1_i1.p1  ORF type:complete len:311 (+),score=48.39 TRINITY_DN9128_c0_g1_i1:31-963(+)